MQTEVGAVVIFAILVHYAVISRSSCINPFLNTSYKKHHVYFHRPLQTDSYQRFMSSWCVRRFCHDSIVQGSGLCPVSVPHLRQHCQLLATEPVRSVVSAWQFFPLGVLTLYHHVQIPHDSAHLYNNFRNETAWVELLLVTATLLQQQGFFVSLSPTMLFSALSILYSIKCSTLQLSIQHSRSGLVIMSPCSTFLEPYLSNKKKVWVIPLVILYII